jgi:S1-C subfamily serine protease
MILKQSIQRPVNPMTIASGSPARLVRDSRFEMTSLSVAIILFVGWLVSWPPVALRGGESPPPATHTAYLSGELEELRAIQHVVVDTIARTSKAFVFLPGGSGFLVSKDGLVLTNEHVVGGQKEVPAVLAGGKRYRLVVLGHDPEGDVALLKVKDPLPGPLPYLELGDSESLRVGQRVIALGDPFLIASANLFLGSAPPDQEPSASFGIVSALHRFSDVYSDAIQVDVAVNRGNSGGPLLNLDGEVMGINGKIETRFAIGVNSGVGYTIPSNQIRNFLETLESSSGGNVRHGSIAGLEVADRADGQPGLLIMDVDEDSTAATTGFRVGDVLLSIEGLTPYTSTRYRGILSTFPVGRKVAVRVERQDQVLELKVPIEVRGPAFLGIRMEDAPQGGALVKEVVAGSSAEKSGLKVDDIIVFFQGGKIATFRDLRKLLDARQAGDEVILGVVRGGKLMTVRLRLKAPRERV